MREAQHGGIPENGTDARPREMTGFSQRALFAVGVVVAAALALALIWAASTVFLLIFAGVLVAVLLTGLTDWLVRHASLPHGVALASVVLALLALLIGGIWFLSPSVSDQVDQLAESLPKALDRLREQAEHYRWVQTVLERTPSAEELLPPRRDVLTSATGVFSTTLGAIANVVIVLFIGLFLAAEPTLYQNGLLRLVPPARRGRAAVVLAAVGYTLRWWLIGKLISMTVVGVLTWIGLALLGVPLALTLGLLAAILTFIPNIGPILSAVPAVLLGLLDGPMQALYVVLLYVGIQTVESYLITPLVQRRTVSLPPALTISAQVLLGVLLGAIGLLLATPLTAMALVLVKMLYVEDALGDHTIEVKAEEQVTGRA